MSIINLQGLGVPNGVFPYKPQCFAIETDQDKNNILFKFHTVKEKQKLLAQERVHHVLVDHCTVSWKIKTIKN